MWQMVLRKWDQQSRKQVGDRVLWPFKTSFLSVMLRLRRWRSRFFGDGRVVIVGFGVLLTSSWVLIRSLEGRSAMLARDLRPFHKFVVKWPGEYMSKEALDNVSCGRVNYPMHCVDYVKLAATVRGKFSTGSVGELWKPLELRCQIVDTLKIWRWSEALSITSTELKR